MTAMKIKRLEDLPDLLTPQQVADYIGISRKRVYEFCQLKESAGGLVSFLIGKSRKIEKQEMVRWLDSMKEVGTNYESRR
ncbi:helix-turn-helix domain-containing protein [Paenibacillus sp. GM2]|uniref:helix-turn-helix domain-containing protein n=1 Tax=Paenibacillus sp. GM2 TaxID=1622070 RepID=UPI0008385EE8|nr:helix-turn-helix domain-containing protein [Paenibacillus sp. GM2]